jgi:ketosteroid isomerase-like protein
MSNAAVFRTYLDRFAAGDLDRAGELLVDDFTFAGPLVQATSKAEFLAGAAGFVKMARGYEMHRQWVDGDDVCSVFDFKIDTPVGPLSILMTEWVVVRDGKLVSSRLVFDTATVAAMRPVSQPA